jgi:sortase A
VKTSVPIITSFAMGTLVMLGLHWHGSDTHAVQPAGSTAATVRAEPVAAMRSAAPAKVRTSSRVAGPARIAIPRLHLKFEVGNSLEGGPAWWPVTGRPGGGDTVAIAGHRTTHTHPFLDLDRLEPGNAIYLRWEGVTYRYSVSGRRILSNRQRHIGDARGREVLILTTCTPKGSARQRLVVYALPDGNGDRTPAS